MKYKEVDDNEANEILCRKWKTNLAPFKQQRGKRTKYKKVDDSEAYEFFDGRKTLVKIAFHKTSITKKMNAKNIEDILKARIW